MARVYSDEDRAGALAALQLNQGNIKLTCRQLEIPRRTLKDWRKKALETGVVARDAVMPPPPADWVEVNRLAGSKFLALADEAADIVKENLAQFHGGGLNAGDLQRVATIMGISADKAFAFLVGKNGFNVNVDARSIHVGDSYKEMPLDELRQLAGQLAAASGNNGVAAAVESDSP